MDDFSFPYVNMKYHKILNIKNYSFFMHPNYNWAYRKLEVASQSLRAPSYIKQINLNMTFKLVETNRHKKPKFLLI